jgi:hypothetical protein
MLLMNKTFTPENLLLYAYDDEDDLNQKQSVRKLIQNDTILYEEYLQIMEIKQEIEKSFTSPSNEVINRIMSYSRSLAVFDIAEPDLRLVIQN